MLNRTQQSSPKPPSALRSASQGSASQSSSHRIQSIPPVSSHIDSGSIAGDAVDLTSPGFSGAGDEMDTIGIGQDLGFAQNTMVEDSPEPEITKQTISFRSCAPLPLPNTPAFAEALPATSDVRDTTRRISASKPTTTTSILTKGKVPDFFAWNADSTENLLNEHVIRNGFADKPPGSNQSESHTARPSVWPSIKNKSGLPVLSALLVQVMEKRQASGRCTAPSTFKPPPRVTLTDTKRESWLRDLASSNVPLRRLSRTIPHGIRGKTLLDHCLAKTIPIPRAVWLAKCVGANELRAFRRKGISGSAAMTGEAKWIREWTVLVESFLYAVIADCGPDNWRTKMDYAIRLVTAFFAENLLDNEHYLSWLLGCFESATLDNLPMWIVFVQLYWKQLVKQQRRGRRLAEALLDRLGSLSIDDSPKPNAALLIRLERLVITLASAHGDCLVALQKWDKHRSILERILASQPANGTNKLLQLQIARNDRLRLSAQSSQGQPQSAKLQVINMLSSMPIIFDLQKTISQCTDMLPSSRDLMNTLLGWAASKFKTGHHRLYVVCSILRHRQENGPDIELDLLNSLSELAAQDSFDPRILYRIATRLVQSGQFSFGKYLQWLISMGALSGTGNRTANLLIHLPVDSCPPHLLNLRRTLMQRLGLSLVEDYRLVQHLHGQLQQLIRQTTPDEAVLRDFMSALSSLDEMSRSRFCQKIRTDCAERAHTELYEMLADSPTALGLLRHIAELWEDYDLLSCVLQSSCRSNQPAVLSGVVDTLNMHAKVFGAMGSMKEFFSTVFKKQRLLRTQQPLDRPFLLALSQLSVRIRADSDLKKMLATDLAVCEHQGSAAACSPASDNMVLTNAGAIATDADIDRILASGNTMDDQVMARLFSAIVERCVKQASSQVPDIVTCSRWFTQLRLFDHANFDRLSQNLLTKLVGNAGIEQIRILLTALVGSNCLDIDVAFQAFERRIDSMSSSNVTTTARLALAGLQVFIPRLVTFETSLDFETYRFRLAQHAVCREKRSSLLHFLKWSFSAIADPSVVIATDIFLALLREYANEDPLEVTNTFIEARNMTAEPSRIDNFLSSLLNAGFEGRSMDKTNPEFEAILALLDEFSLAVCRVILKQTPADSISSGPAEDASAQLEAVKGSINQGHSLWPQLIDCMPGRVVKEVHQWASEEIIREINNSLTRPEDSTTSSIEQARTYLRIMVTSLSSERQTIEFDMTVMVERFLAFGDHVEGTDTSDGPAMGRVCAWLAVMLQFTATCCEATVTANSTLSQQGELLGICCNMLAQIKLQGQHSTLDNLFDVASLLASKLSADQLASVHRQLQPIVRSNVRVAFLLGNEQMQSGWLTLASKTPSVAPLTSPTVPQGAFTPLIRQGQPPNALQRTASQSNTSEPSSQRSQMPSTPQGRLGVGMPQEIRYTPYVVRPWETMSDPTPNMGENDTSLSLTLFAARKAI